MFSLVKESLAIKKKSEKLAMNGENLNEPKYLFFLQLSQRLPDSYFRLAAYLIDYDVTLVPIYLNDLLKISVNDFRPSILMLNNSLESNNNYQIYRKKFLDFALQTNKYVIYEISSFSPNPNSYKVRKNEYYNYYQLPIEIEYLASEIARIAYKHSSVKSAWPGGKNFRLPNQVLS